MLVYYFLPFIVNNRYLLFQVSSGHNSVTVENRTHVHMNFFAQNHSYYHFPKQCRFLLNHPVFYDAAQCYKYITMMRSATNILRCCAVLQIYYDAARCSNILRCYAVLQIYYDAARCYKCQIWKILICIKLALLKT